MIVNKNYSNEDRLELAKEAVLLINEYRKYQNENNYIELINTRQRLCSPLLCLAYSVFNISNVNHQNSAKFKIQDEGVEESIQDTAMTMLDKIEEDKIDTSGYDEYPEKLISFMKSILEGKLLNLRKKEVKVYQKHEVTYDKNGEEIDRTEYVSVESIDNVSEDGKAKQFADPNSLPNNNDESEDLLIKLRRILDELKETDKDGKYIEYLFGEVKYKKKDIAEIFGVSDSIISRKEKRLIQLITERMRQ